MVRKTKDQQVVEEFIEELTASIIKRYKKDIDFIVLFGSAARGDFIIGVSDIDLIIQTKSAKAVKSIENYATKKFWLLDKKYKTGFRKACSISKSETLFGKIINSFEKTVGLYVPIFIFAPGEIDWKNGRYLMRGYMLGAKLFGPVASIFNKIRLEGKILYGRDIRKEISPKIDFWEKFKTIIVPSWLTFGALMILPFMPKKAVKNCAKAILYEVDAALFYLDKLEIRDTKFKKEQLKELIEINLIIKFDAMASEDLDIIEEALKYKREGFNGTRKQARQFVWKSRRFVDRLNSIVVAKGLLKL